MEFIDWYGTLGRRALLAAIILVAALFTFSAGADAKLARTRHGTVAYVPGHSARLVADGLRGQTPEEEFWEFEESFGPLTKGAGPVMKTDTNYLVVWQPKGTKFPAHYVERVTEYLRDIAAYPGGVKQERTNTESVLSQYGVKKNYFGGVIVDKHPFPENGCEEATTCLTDEQLQQELVSVVREHGLPLDLTREYHLITPPGAETCFNEEGTAICSLYAKSSYFCAYHNGVEPSPGQYLVYSDEPFEFNGPSVEGYTCEAYGWQPAGPAASGAIDVLSHEHSESVTDPLPPTGWVGSEEWEIGDICAWNPGAAIGETTKHQKFNQLINGSIYANQQEWSNKAGRCVQHS